MERQCAGETTYRDMPCSVSPFLILNLEAED